MIPEKFAVQHSSELLAALEDKQCVSIRYNPFKPTKKIEGQQVEWCTNGIYLAERPIFTLDPLFHGGAYYPQEASSMFVGWMVERLGMSKPRVLDLCAAPGGKTTQITEYADVVVSNDVIRSRAKVLSENVERWGSGNVAVTCNDPRDFGERLPSYFDILVIDTPCSGEGMFRKEPAAREEWSPENVELCAARSRRIVSDAWAALREGGVLIYSTCTFNRLENDENALWICRELGGEIIHFEDVPQGIVCSEAGYHFYPHKVVGEGFYAVAIRKEGGEETADLRAKKGLLPAAELAELSKWVGGELDFRVGGGNVYGFTKGLVDVVNILLDRRFNLQYSGVMMGEMIRGALKPAHSLATYFNVRYEQRVEFELEIALEYLRKGNISADYCVDEGLNLVTFNDLPIGWIKKISNRTNNLYPSKLRILHY